MLYRIQGKHPRGSYFVVGVETKMLDGHEVIVRAPPLVKWAIGDRIMHFIADAERRGWKVESIS